jgi:transposase
MSRGYSIDLRERVIAAIEGGMSRRGAARHFLIGESSAIKWCARWLATGSFAEKPGVKLNSSPLDAHTPWLLALVANEPDLTLAEIRARLLEERQVQTGGSSVWRFFNRHGISFKKNRTRERTKPGGRGQGAQRMERGAVVA